MERKILSVLPLESMQLLLWFDPSDVRKLDALRLSTEKPFGMLLQNGNFGNVRVCPDGTGITWGDSFAIDSPWLYAHSKSYDVVEAEKRRLLRELIDSRHACSMSQVSLGQIAGIRQPVISRIEGGSIAPQINTLLKLLAPMGKTLQVVDLPEAFKD